MIDLHDKSPEELQRLIAEAQVQLQAKQQSKRKEVIAQMKELAASIGVTITIHGDDKKEGKRASSSVAAKYRNPNNDSETWTGRGLMPRWLRELVDSGRSKEEFLIS